MVKVWVAMMIGLRTLRVEARPIRALLAVSCLVAMGVLCRPSASFAVDRGPLAVVNDGPGLDEGAGPGVLRIGERCTTLEDRRGGPLTLVWSDDAIRWDADRRQIVFRDPDLGRLQLGDGARISVGGWAAGTLSKPNTGPDLSWVKRPHATCPADIWVVHQVSPQELPPTSTVPAQHQPMSGASSATVWQLAAPVVVGMGMLWQRRRRAAGDEAEVTGRERWKWDQERAILGWIDSKSQWTDKLFNSVFLDQIGRIDDKKFHE